MKKPLKISKLIKIIIKIIFMVIFSIVLIYNIMSIHNKKDYIEFMEYKIYVVKDYQVQKTIEKDTVLIVKSKNNDFQRNDLVAIKISAGTYFHRIVDIIGKGRYVTKGDDNYEPDRITFSEKDIEGKIIKQIPGFGKILNIVSTKSFSVIMLIIFMIFRLLG